jgi:glycosyltransferase involved in cell wall biosynthesis
LRVAQLVETLDAGGAEALAVDIAGELAVRGHESHLIVARGDGPFRNRALPSVAFHDLGRPRRDGSQVYRIAHFLEMCRRLEAMLRSDRIDVLQTHLPKANFLGLVMAWRGVCRVYPTVHNNREFDYGDRAGRTKRALRRAGYRQMLRHCRAVIAVSEQVKASLVEELGVGPGLAARIAVVPNGVRIGTPPAPDRLEALRAAWGAAEGQALIIGAGRLTPQKDFASLVAALAGLESVSTDWRCVIAGDGELRADLESRIEAAGLRGRVRLAGLIDDLPALLAAADLFCLPSRFEGLPLVLLEAMAAGLPTVAFAIDGVTDVVHDGRQACLAPPGDIHAFADAIASLLNDRNRCREMGAAAHALAAGRYGFGTTVDRLEAVYRT